MKILILKNIEREGPGLITDWLNLNFITYEILEVSTELLTQNLINSYDGLIVLGGPSSANDTTPIIQQELEFISNWLKTDKPYLGICLGMQLMVKAKGGEVFSNKTKEIGFYHLNNHESPYKVRLQNDTLSTVLPPSFPVFQLHGETVYHPEIPSLGQSDWCNYQICASKDNQLGVQFHLELTEEMLEDWLSQDDDLILADKSEYLKHYKTNKQEFRGTCFSLLKYIFNS